eukprot:TRINITY_DN29891_c0_g1_i1.p1 TRINITY_DN29891_c0_g1~~TRINITY_DN29891_c0_g1_i1.p1  ORF type:complete len:312 (-),score=37.97 TRINITY_DN29891_c0_g1_i1:249-1184(-)
MQLEAYSSREFHQYCLSNDLRGDTRTAMQHRSTQLETATISTSLGSALVCRGNSKVVAALQHQFVPFGDMLDPVVDPLEITVEFPSLVVDRKERGLQSVNYQTNALSAFLSDNIKKYVLVNALNQHLNIDDDEALTDKPQKKIKLNLDVCILNPDGALKDICLLAAMAALLTARMPPELVEAQTEARQAGWKCSILPSVPIISIPIATTFGCLDGKLVVDLTESEEQQFDSRWTVIVIVDVLDITKHLPRGTAQQRLQQLQMPLDSKTLDNSICNVHNPGGHPVASELLQSTIQMAKDNAVKLLPLLCRHK